MQTLSLRARSDDFSYRVNYAAQCIVRNTNSRRFSSCFEMNDGDAVVVALVRRSWTNKKLYDAIARQWGGEFPSEWTELADKYNSVPSRDLSKLAATMREKWGD